MKNFSEVDILKCIVDALYEIGYINFNDETQLDILAGYIAYLVDIDTGDVMDILSKVYGGRYDNDVPLFYLLRPDKIEELTYRINDYFK